MSTPSDLFTLFNNGNAQHFGKQFYYQDEESTLTINTDGHFVTTVTCATLVGTRKGERRAVLQYAVIRRAYACAFVTHNWWVGGVGWLIRLESTHAPHHAPPAHSRTSPRSALVTSQVTRSAPRASHSRKPVGSHAARLICARVSRTGWGTTACARRRRRRGTRRRRR